MEASAAEPVYSVVKLLMDWHLYMESLLVAYLQSWHPACYQLIEPIHVESPHSSCCVNRTRDLEERRIVWVKESRLHSLLQRLASSRALYVVLSRWARGSGRWYLIEQSRDPFHDEDCWRQSCLEMPVSNAHTQRTCECLRLLAGSFEE